MARKAKNLKVTQCHNIILDEFKKFTDPRPFCTIKLTDILMSSFAVFSLKCPSLLSFEDELRFGEEKRRIENLMRLYNIERVPSDTQLRDVLDFINHSQYRSIFKNLFSYVQRAKTLESFEFIKLNNDPYYLIACDGTGYFRSEKIQCQDCLVSEHIDKEGNATIKYGHNMLAGSLVHPNQKQVIPFYPEPIARLDGTSKNDSEQTAFRRFLEKLRSDHPKLKLIFLLDALYANGPIIKLLREFNYEFIIAVKNTKSLLFTLIKEGETDGATNIFERSYNTGEKVIKTTKLTYRYQNNVRLHQDENTPFINFVDLIEETTWIDRKGKAQKKVQRFAFITDIKVTNSNVEQLAQGGRTRWKIENETFNTLKNRGYYFEHNFGHGNHHLSYNFIMSMFLAFFVDQIQELSCTTFKKIVDKAKRKQFMWRRLASAFDWLELQSFDHLYALMLDEEFDTG
jgi:hypothetical protein